MSKELNELLSDVTNWATDKGIFNKATSVTQMTKTIEEVAELNTAVVKNDKQNIIDGIGDVLVTLQIQADMQGVTLAQCLDYVLYKNDSPLLKREGKMINGVFVKNN